MSLTLCLVRHYCPTPLRSRQFVKILLASQIEREVGNYNFNWFHHQPATTTSPIMGENEERVQSGDAVQPPRPLVICGPSGTGKSTLLNQLIDEFTDYLGHSISHTTRQPRKGEEDGIAYHFTDRESMLSAITRGEFIEHTEFSGNIYGTSKKSVRDVQNKGKICILDVEIEGVKNLKKTDLNPRFVFVKPPSIHILEQRLRSRGSETQDTIARRLTQAKEELQYGSVPGNFDIVIVNDDFEEAYSNLRNFILKDVEELRKSRGM